MLPPASPLHRPGHVVVSVRSVGAAYFFFLIGCQYLYFGRPGVQLLYWFTFGGGLVWTVIDFFRIPSMVDAENEALIHGFSSAPAPHQEKSNVALGVGLALAILILGGVIIYTATATPPPATPQPSKLTTGQLQQTSVISSSVRPAATAAAAATRNPKPETRNPVPKAQTVSRVPGTKRDFIRHDVDISTISAMGGSGGDVAKRIPNPSTKDTRNPLDRPAHR